MNSGRPPQRPYRPPLTREEAMRRQAYYRKKKKQQMQRRIAFLAIAALFLILTVILITVALHRSSEQVDLPDPGTTDAQTTNAQDTSAVSETTAPPPTEKGITICIDPGHGFDDPGATTTYLGEYTESDITLAIALKLRALLEERGYTVIMTHDTNDIPADAPKNEVYLFRLQDRTDFANLHKPDLFLSIHGDTYEDPEVHGTRVYFQSITGADNTAITRTAQNFVDALTLSVPNAQRAPLLKEMADENAYYVLRHVDMPAVLIEVGFASNPTDTANMLDETWQAQIAEGMADGVDMTFGQ